MQPFMTARAQAYEYVQEGLGFGYPFMTARAQAYEYVQEYNKAINCIEAFNASLMPGDMTTVTPLYPEP